MTPVQMTGAKEPAAQPEYTPASASSDRAARLAAGVRPAAPFIACRAWPPGAGPSAGKQASGAGGPTLDLAKVHHG